MSLYRFIISLYTGGGLLNLRQITPGGCNISDMSSGSMAGCWYDMDMTHFMIVDFESTEVKSYVHNHTRKPLHCVFR